MTRRSGDVVTGGGTSEVEKTSTSSPAPHVARSRPNTLPTMARTRGFGDQQPGQAAATGAERPAQRQLALTSGATGDQQVGDVGAGDQQHAGGDGHEDRQRRRQLLLQLGLAVAGVDDVDARGEELLLRLGDALLEPGLLRFRLPDRAEERLQASLRPLGVTPGCSRA